MVLANYIKKEVLIHKFLRENGRKVNNKGNDQTDDLRAKKQDSEVLMSVQLR